MARLFRFVQKKRGKRHTGSNLMGSVGEAVFCGSLFLLGTLLLSVIVATQLIEPNPRLFLLGVGGWLLVLVTASSMVLGAGGLIWTAVRVGTSAERRSALARRAADIDIVNHAVPVPRDYPTLPSLDGLTNSPGIELAYRLPASQSPGWRLLATTIFAMLWNAAVCLLTVSVINGIFGGRHSWLFAGALLPLWGVCYWSIRAFLQLLVTTSGMGQMTVEISDLPLAPGHACQVVVAQHGQATIRSLQAWLVCEEEATFTQGTDIRTEVREVYRQSCLTRREVAGEVGGPFTATGTMTVPPSAMHSFQSAHNAIRWKLIVRADANGWPAAERGFPLVVYPGESTMQVELGSHVTRQALMPPGLPVPAAVGARA